MALAPCPCCNELRPSALPACPHCGTRGLPRISRTAAALFGLSLIAGCGKKDDTGEDTGTTTSAGTAQALYGAPATGTMSRSVEESEELAAELVKRRNGPLATPED